MSSAEILLDYMSISDKPQLIKLIRNTSEFEPDEIPIAEEIIDAYLDCPNQYYTIKVAKIESIVVGYVCFGQTPLTKSTWDIYWMAVDNEKRRIGIGKTLLKSAEEEIFGLRGKLILVETSSKPNYLNTRKFYKRNGYRQVSRITDFYAPDDHLIIFEKRF
jgi:ribosomal protein S18 acetylase RimI-like enzyme